MKLKPILSIVCISFICWQCTTSQVLVDYSVVSVPEEGGMQFVQYTREDEKVVYPSVVVDPITQKLQWYAAPLISISSDGEKLAYLARANEYYNLYLKNIAGGKSTIQRTFNRHVSDMTFSPDGTKIAFTENRGGNNNIYMINANEGAAVQQVTASNANELGPQFSSDGSTVYFSKEEEGRWYVWNINLKTSLLTQFSEGFTPSLAQDDNLMIVTRNSKDGKHRGEIWTIDLKLGTETLILNDPTTGFSSPAISPNGRSIICVGSTQETLNRPQNLDLYIVNIDGTNLRQITFHGGHDTSPQWSPDGKSVFFISQRGNANGDANVWKIDI